jgi:hypothetical protein
VGVDAGGAAGDNARRPPTLEHPEPLVYLRTCAALAALVAGLGAARAAPATSATAWRAARWGMTVDEVVAAFPGEASKLDPPQTLADGNVVAVGIEKHLLDGQSLRVRFVFAGGRLALVSLRTPPDAYAQPEAFTRLQERLTAELGPPAAQDADDNLIDLRQTRWVRGGTAVDLKYIPGVVVVLYHPSPDAASRPAGAP